MATCTQCKKRYDDALETCPDDGSALLPDAMVAAADTTLPAGTKLGEYVVEAKIGEGAYGAVYAAEHPVIGKRAAIKVLAKKYASDLAVVSRFVTEARAVNRIRHPNIVDIFAIGQQGELHFLAMELLEGEPLDEHLQRRGHLEPAEALDILRGVAEALDAAHQAGIVHRDLKPDNVFLVRDKGGFRPKLLDFGVAKLHGDGDLMHKTATGIAIGTPFYMSPEQCRGKKVDFASDIYSLGAMTYQMLTGVAPFDGESVMDVLMKHIHDTPEPMSKHRPELGGMLDAAVATMLAKKPTARPASAGAAIELLGSAAATSRPLLLDEARRIAGATVATTVSAGTPTATPTVAGGASTGERPTVRPGGADVSARESGRNVSDRAPSSPGAISAATEGEVASSPASSSGMVPRASTLGPTASASHARPTAFGLRVGIGIGVVGASLAAIWFLRTPAPPTPTAASNALDVAAPASGTSAPGEPPGPPEPAPPIVVEPAPSASAPTAVVDAVEPAPPPAPAPVSPRPAATKARGGPGGATPPSPTRLPPSAPPPKPSAPAPSAKPPASAAPGAGLLDSRD